MTKLKNKKKRIDEADASRLNSREDKQKALDAGFSGHLTKPIGIKEISDMLKTLLPAAGV